MRSVIVILKGEGSTIVSEDSSDLAMLQPGQTECNQNPERRKQCGSGRGTATFLNPRDCHTSPTAGTNRAAGVITIEWDAALGISETQERDAFMRWVPPRLEDAELRDWELTFDSLGNAKIT